MKELSANKSVAKSAGVIGVAILSSRLLGFLRDIIIARVFGVYIYAQAFVVAFRIPNLLRDLLGEGAANSAFVPVLSEYRAKYSTQEFWKLANVVLNLLLVVLMGIVLLGVTFAPVIVRGIAPGFIADPEKLEVTIRLTRIIFPYILLISLVAYSMGVLNSLRHFAVPAFSPCLLNISIIVFVLLFNKGIKGLALGVLIGGLLQLCVQIPVLYKKGMRWQPFKPWEFRHPGAKTIGLLMLPRLFSSCVYQLNNFIDSIFGSLARIVGEGGVAVLYFAYRLILFPLGIFANSLSQAMLPTLSTQAVNSDRGDLKNTLNFGIRAVFLVMTPSSVGLMVLSRPIIFNLFAGGRFDFYSAQATSGALFFYSLGLTSYGLTRIIQTCFFALKDTWTPAKIAFISTILNIILNFILMYPLKISGLALATSISGINTSLILFIILNKKIGGLDLKRLLSSFLRILAASAGMGVVCYLLLPRGYSVDATIKQRALDLGSVIIAGGASYILFCILLKIGEMRELLNLFFKRLRQQENR